MGCCLSKGNDGDRDHLELSDSVSDAVTCKCGLKGEQVQMSKIDGKNNFVVSGKGTVIGSCALEGDTSTWQVRMGPSPEGVKVGIKRFNKKKPCDLTTLLNDVNNDADSPVWFLNDVSVKEGDVIGVYWDQTDLPMLSFSLNGQLLVDSSVMRIRPAHDLYPAFSVAGGGSSCEVIFDGEQFAHPPISSKFKMIICSTNLI